MMLFEWPAPNINVYKMVKVQPKASNRFAFFENKECIGRRRPPYGYLVRAYETVSRLGHRMFQLEHFSI